MTTPVDAMPETGPTQTVEPGALVFFDQAPGGFTDEEVFAVLRGAPPVPERSPGGGLTAAADVVTGAMIAFVPRVEDADMLALADGEPSDQLHCTSVYLGDAVDFDDQARADIIAAMTELATETAPVLAAVFGFGILNPGGEEPCLVANVGGSDLADLQETVTVLAVENDWVSQEQHAPWLAHITLGYDPDPRRWLTDDVLAQTGPILLDRIRVAFAGVTTDLPLTGDQMDDGGDAPASPEPGPTTPDDGYTDLGPETEGEERTFTLSR